MCGGERHEAEGEWIERARAEERERARERERETHTRGFQNLV
jgi:hypothetical protein